MVLCSPGNVAEASSNKVSPWLNPVQSLISALISLFGLDVSVRAWMRGSGSEDRLAASVEDGLLFFLMEDETRHCCIHHHSLASALSGFTQ